MNTWEHRGVTITLNGDGEFCCTAEGKFKAASSLPAAKKFIDSEIDKTAKSFPDRDVIFTKSIATEYLRQDTPPKSFVFRLTDFRMERMGRARKQWVATGTRLFPVTVTQDRGTFSPNKQTFVLEDEIFIDYTPEALAKLEELHDNVLRLKAAREAADKAVCNAAEAAFKFRRPDGRTYPSWVSDIISKTR